MHTFCVCGQTTTTKTSSNNFYCPLGKIYRFNVVWRIPKINWTKRKLNENRTIAKPNAMRKRRKKLIWIVERSSSNRIDLSGSIHSTKEDVSIDVTRHQGSSEKKRNESGSGKKWIRGDVFMLMYATTFCRFTLLSILIAVKVFFYWTESINWCSRMSCLLLLLKGSTIKWTTVRESLRVCVCLHMKWIKACSAVA